MWENSMTNSTVTTSRSRRDALRLLAAAFGACSGILPAGAAILSGASSMIEKTIPSSGESLPVIGLGTGKLSMSAPMRRHARRWKQCCANSSRPAAS
jgi:hypothetical protein